MEKNHDRAIFESVYEIKGSLELIRGDLKHYFKQIGWVLWLILLVLFYIAFK